jgi:hypothetical protein
MAARTDADLDQALVADRRHVEEWRSTPEGEADYQATVERVKAVAERLRAAS